MPPLRPPSPLRSLPTSPRPPTWRCGPGWLLTRCPTLAMTTSSQKSRAWPAAAARTMSGCCSVTATAAAARTTSTALTRRSPPCRRATGTARSARSQSQLSRQSAAAAGRTRAPTTSSASITGLSCRRNCAAQRGRSIWARCGRRSQRSRRPVSRSSRHPPTLQPLPLPPSSLLRAVALCLPSSTPVGARPPSSSLLSSISIWLRCRLRHRRHQQRTQRGRKRLAAATAAGASCA